MPSSPKRRSILKNGGKLEHIKYRKTGLNLKSTRMSKQNYKHTSYKFCITFLLLTGVWLGPARERPTIEELVEKLDSQRKMRYKSQPPAT